VIKIFELVDEFEQEFNISRLDDYRRSQEIYSRYFWLEKVDEL
jgi:hypothetical protein